MTFEQQVQEHVRAKNGNDWCVTNSQVTEDGTPIFGLTLSVCEGLSIGGQVSGSELGSVYGIGIFGGKSMEAVHLLIDHFTEAAEPEAEEPEEDEWILEER